MTKTEIRKLEKLYSVGRNYALEILKRDSLALMRRYPKYTCFYLAMGRWFFTDSDNENVWNATCMKGISDFISEWDRHYKLTGEGIYIKQNGDICDKW